jgi:small subunit ribosomal protein S8
VRRLYFRFGRRFASKRLEGGTAWIAQPGNLTEERNMTMTDPISDMLTRVRNGLMAKHAVVELPASKTKTEIARILKEEGYIQDYTLIEDRRQGTLRIHLKYNPDGSPVISGFERVSRPGRRVYTSVDDIPDVLGGLGVSILSTPRGILTSQKSKKENVGGEVLCNVW